MFFFPLLPAASVLKAVSRYGKKQVMVDETRRDTYRNPVTVGKETPVLTAFEDNFKQLLAVRNSVLFFFFLFFLSTREWQTIVFNELV
jgi:hypothetical protein